jgi:acetyl-CoA carboxylase/biotin carboxylase 1
VWPGWGHASENPRLPNSLKAKGIQVRYYIGTTTLSLSSAMLPSRSEYVTCPCGGSLLSFSAQFIGPTAPVMAALGDKVSANILAQTAKVPSIPWSGQGIECELNEEVGDVFLSDIFCVYY